MLLPEELEENIILNLCHYVLPILETFENTKSKLDGKSGKCA
jgi:hypothetical protein